MGQLCILLNVNLRFEGYYLNLKLRQNFLKNNLKIISINSITNLTFPVVYLGSTMQILKEIVEGNHLLNQSFVSSINPYIIQNSENIKRQQNFNLIEFFKIIKKNNFNFYNSNWNGFNNLTNTLSDSGFNLYSKLEILNFYDYKTINILHIINIKFNFLNMHLKKYLDLKLLNFTNTLNLLLLI